MRFQHRPLFATFGLALAVLATAGGFLEATLLAERATARKALLPALARVEAGAVETTHEAARLARRRAWPEAAETLATATEVTPKADLHAVAALAARASGDFEKAARHQSLAARLSPGDDAATEAANAALDRALLARFRTPARVLVLLGLATMLVLGRRRHVQKRRRRSLDAWLDGIRGEIQVRLDGQTPVPGRVVTLRPDGSAVTLDVFLRSAGRRVSPPRPGPTLSLVLSHAGSSRSVRLTPRRHVREDAVRVRIRDESLEHVLARPGRWRIQARLDGRLFAEAPMQVEAKAARRIA